MKYFAPAKLNLALDVLNKRPDGYHNLSMIMQTVSVFDVIGIEKAEGISVSCNKTYIPCNEKNTVFKACQLFFKETNIKGGCKIHITKTIPDGAGLGGGSSDAGETLLALNEIYGTNLSENKLLEMSVKIGADVPFFIKKGCCIAEGIGERLTPIKNNLNPYVLIYKPRFSVSTKEAYGSLNLGKVREEFELVKKSISDGDLGLFSKSIFNVFEDAIGKKYNEIYAIKNKMKNLGANASMMTGSGSAIFGIFEDKISALKAFKNFDSHKVFLAKFI